MRGRILSYSDTEHRGSIAGDDGQRYDFVGTDWQGRGEPAIGERVDFRTDEARANNIRQLAAAQSVPSSAQPTQPDDPPPPYGQPFPPYPRRQPQRPHTQPAMAPTIMGFGKAIKTCFEKYATFGGRARRSEFWYFVLFIGLVRVATFIADMTLTRGARGSGLFSALAALALLVPLLAVMTRRMHDVERSGYWLLGASLGMGLIVAVISLDVFIHDNFVYDKGSDVSMTVDGIVSWTCILGFLGITIRWLMLLCRKGTHGPNPCGPDPRYPPADAAAS